ncbi:pentatricopeptide repeat-containing protein At2g17670 [Impatiens glandulifera]|uniref:pentatricopeptide repeat-containing protein At2g17670 n=1 Tax=Impatiens glandulifera TaxID=253017 RepID=UPI001FB05907|nr:pentatricopeptide repeat-containing protein At2g17670 [Impatiens glandulifera]
MGKIPPGLKQVAQYQASTILKNHSSPSPPPVPKKPRNFPDKSSNRTPRKSSTTQNPHAPSIIFKSPSLSDAKTLFNSFIASVSPSSVASKFPNSFLQSFSAVSSLDDSISLIKHMAQTHTVFSPERSTYHIILSQACKSSDVPLSSVRRTLDLMAQEGFPPDKVTTDIAIRSLCSVDRLDDAVDLIKELCLRHAPPDSYTYNCVIRCLCKNRCLSTVNNFIRELRESFDVKPDLIAYTILIDNVCNQKNLREAIRLLDLLNQEGFKPDTYVYNIIMKGYCMLSRASEVLWVFNKMNEDKVEPDLVTYNTLIFGLSKSGRVNLAQKYLKVMAEMGHFPDAVTYTSLMNGMCREGNVLSALELLEEMESKGCDPNSCTYNTLLQGLCKAKKLDKATELYSAMKSGEMKLESGSYGSLVRALCRNGRVADCYEVFDYVVDSKSLTEVSAYSTLEINLKWLKKAKEQGLAV